MNGISIVLDSIRFYLLKRSKLLTSTELLCDDFITLHYLRLTSFKTRDVTLKYAHFFLNFSFMSGEGQFYCIEK